jgi:hypothetical protein
MKNILQLFFLLTLFISCQSKKTADISGCYRMVIKSDTATMSLNIQGDSVSGSLSYHWLEKDRNNGTFKGEIRNDTLIVADYTFQSEGKTSVREVAFKIKDSILQQGYGELIQKNDTMFFRDANLIIFDTKNPFRKGCE